MFIQQNNNRLNKVVDDCVIRAIATASGKSWSDVFWDLSVLAYLEGDLLNSNTVWGKYLISNGFVRHSLPDTCPMCYTVRDFVRDHKHGIFVLGDGSHAIAAVDGCYIDTWDSGDRTVLFYYQKAN